VGAIVPPTKVTGRKVSKGAAYPCRGDSSAGRGFSRSPEAHDLSLWQPFELGTVPEIECYTCNEKFSFRSHHDGRKELEK
jgi:hypothetical protein